MQPNGDGLAQLISKEDASAMEGTGDEAVLEGDLSQPAPDDSSVSSIPVE